MKNILIILLIWLTISGCTDEITDYVQQTEQSYLTIEGGLSDKNEQQIIKLYNSLTKIDNSSLLMPISGAKVYIIDAKGVKINYSETQNGTYITTENVAGQAGNIYTLHMEIAGKIYESSPEIMPVSPEIDKLYFEGTIKTNLPENTKNYAGYDIYLSFKDAAEQGNYYSWSWKHYENLGICAICQGNLNDNTGTCTSNQKAVPVFGYHCDGLCFDISLSQNVNILADNYINGQQVDRVFITRVPWAIDSNLLSGLRYYLQVEQRALTKDSYDFYKMLKETQSGGTLFDVPTLTVFKFNIKCLNDDSQKILGIFDVYSAKRKILNIDLLTKIQNAHVKIIPPEYNECAPECTTNCLESSTRTKIPPEGW